MTDDGIIETYGYTQGLSPEEILIQKEKMEFIIALCRDIKSVLTEKESSLFFEWALGDIGFADIGKKKITSQTRVNIRYSKKGQENARKKNIQKGRQKLYTLKHDDVTYAFNNVRYLLKDKIVKCICNVGKDYTFVMQLFHSRHEEPIVLLCRRGDNGVISVIDSAKSINQLNNLISSYHLSANSYLSFFQ